MQTASAPTALVLDTAAWPWSPRARLAVPAAAGAGGPRRRRRAAPLHVTVSDDGETRVQATSSWSRRRCRGGCAASSSRPAIRVVADETVSRGSSRAIRRSSTAQPAEARGRGARGRGGASASPPPSCGAPRRSCDFAQAELRRTRGLAEQPCRRRPRCARAARATAAAALEEAARGSHVRELRAASRRARRLRRARSAPHAPADCDCVLGAPPVSGPRAARAARERRRGEPRRSRWSRSATRSDSRSSSTCSRPTPCRSRRDSGC